MIAFEYATRAYWLTDDQATLVAESLRNHAKGTRPRDLALGVGLSGNPDWTGGALALAEFTEEALVGNLDGPLPLEGKAAESMCWALRIMHADGGCCDRGDLASLRDALAPRARRLATRPERRPSPERG